MSGTPTILTASTEAELNQDIATVDAATGGSFEIALTTNITEGTDTGDAVTYGAATLSAPPDLYAINLASSVTLAINGNGFALDGADAYRGLFVYAGTVTVDNLTIEDAAAVGGAGGPGGGGGAGLGGGLFVASAGSVTLQDVSFQDDAAIGGSGGNGDDGGGGGLGGAGGSFGGGGGGIGATADGGLESGGPGIVLGAASGGDSAEDVEGGAYGGGGGSGASGGGGGVGGSAGSFDAPSAGGFGGGGGSNEESFSGSNGGFGGGGGAEGGNAAGAGGFGGGGGSGDVVSGGAGGFGGGQGGNATTGDGSERGGGGGLGAGGGVFVQQGGQLTVGAGLLSGGSVTGGAAGSGGASQSGSAFGSGIFLQGDQSQLLAPGSGETLTIDDVIADQSGDGGTGANAGNGGLVVDGAGTVVLGATNTFTGGIGLSSGTLELAAIGAAGSGALTYTGAATLQLDDAALSAGPLVNVITGFGSGDTIDLASLGYSTGGSVSWNDGILTVTEDSGAVTLAVDGDYAGDTFRLSEDAQGTGTDVTVAVCYYPGTRIDTPDGEIPVEQLKIGDMVMTADGGAVPVRWIGRNTVSTRFADPQRVLPIRIMTGALGEKSPRRDLLVSPEHAVLVDGILIQAGALVNGLSVIQERRVPESFSYYHVELDEHALILAEGLPAESFVDNVHRMAFDNWAEHESLYGDATIAEMPLPRAQSRRQVPREIHRRLMVRAIAGFSNKKTAG